MPYLGRLLCWLIATCCFDDGAVSEFQADLISSGQSIPCKLEDIRVGKAIVLEIRIANKLEEPIEIDRVEIFEKDQEVSIVIRHKDQVVGTVTTTPASDRLVSVKFTLDEKSPIWQVPSGVLKFSTASESVEVPFVFQE
jgi:hypothetical protein